MSLAFQKDVAGELDVVIGKLSESLKTIGFGILTRIDFHDKIKEKLGRDIPKTVILGACNPQLAFDIYSIQPDVTTLLPCNVVVTQKSAQVCSVQIAKPSAMLSVMQDERLAALVEPAEVALQNILRKI